MVRKRESPKLELTSELEKVLAILDASEEAIKQIAKSQGYNVFVELGRCDDGVTLVMLNMATDTVQAFTAASFQVAVSPSEKVR